VKLAAGIGQHFEHVVFGLFGRVGYVEGWIFGPDVVPAGLDFFEVEWLFGDDGLL
jgi:hypothetical protein